MAKRKALYITGGIVVLLAVILTIFIIFNIQKNFMSVIIMGQADKATVKNTPFYCLLKVRIYNKDCDLGEEGGG